ncbi:MAG: hypothetical protein K2Y37_08670 [Pirellulales bacterium]|nr:hypothetical protein [Pirellulales bacterium]
MSPSPEANQPAAPADPPPAPEVLKAALKAFKKRLKLTQLDDASRIGRGPMSSGGKSAIAAITPPNQYPRRVWEELVAQGKLSSEGHGMYALRQG